MSTLEESVDDFLSLKRIAVAGVSRQDGAGNAIYKKLRGAGYQVFATNPMADEVEGDPCYADLISIPDGVDGVVVATPPEKTEDVVRECAELGINRVWIHRSFGQGSISDPAVVFCHENNIDVIPAGCPMMFSEPVDFGHKCMRWLLNLTGGLPKEV